MPHTSPWRASRGVGALFVATGLGFGVLLWLTEGELGAGVAVATATVLVLLPAYLQVAYRLSWRLSEFASQVPGDPEATEGRMGDQSLHWPEHGLTVEGGTHRFRITGLVAEVDGTSRDVHLSRPREGARRILESFGRELALGGDASRFPSVYPRLSGLKAGAVTTFLALIAVALGGPVLAQGVYPRWWIGLALGVGIGIGALRWLGLTNVRRALADLVAGLRLGGVEFERIDRIEGFLRLQFVIKTPEGTAVARCLALPHGSLVIRHGDWKRETGLGDGEAVGRELADRFRARETTPEPTIEVPGPRALTAGQRLVFASLGGVFTLMAAWYIGLPVVERAVIPPTVLAVGLGSGVLGVGLIALAASGQIPGTSGGT